MHKAGSKSSYPITKENDMPKMPKMPDKPYVRKPLKEHKWNYFEIDLWTGKMAKHRAKSDLDLEIILANGDCKKTYEEALELSNRIIDANIRKSAIDGGNSNVNA